MSLGAVTVLASQLVGVTGVAKNIGGMDFQKRFDEAVAAVSSSTGIKIDHGDTISLSSVAMNHVDQHSPENTPADARPIGQNVNVVS